MFRHIGHGVGLRAEHYRHLREHPIDVDWLEVISENFMVAGGPRRSVLEHARRDVDVVLHGVSLGIGGVAALDLEYLRTLRALADDIEPAWVSDHLCWGGFGGHYAHDLLPLPYTDEALAHVVSRVRRVQDMLGRRILLENVSSYVAFNASTMPEAEFVAEVARRADCGILLDLNNVVVSARNHGYSAEAYIDAMPRERIGQLHLAGHDDHGTHLFDSHGAAVPEVVWSLYRYALRTLSPVATLVEWDDEVPPWDVLSAEAHKAAAIEREYTTRQAAS